MMLDSKTIKKLIILQRGEITDSIIYKKLAKKTKIKS